MAGQKTKILWEYFTDPTPGNAKCNICRDMVENGGCNRKEKKKNTPQTCGVT